MNEAMFSKLLLAAQAFEAEDIDRVATILRRVLTEHRQTIASLASNVAENLDEALLALQDSDPTTAGVLSEQALSHLGEQVPSHIARSLEEAARALSHQNYGYAAIALRSVIRHYHPHLTLAATA